MWPVMPLAECLVVSTSALVANALVLRAAMPELGRRATVRLAVGALSVDLLAHAGWARGPTFPVVYWSATFASLVLCFAVLLVPALIVAAILRKGAERVVASRPPSASSTLSRRAFVAGSTAAAPALALGAGVMGFQSANDAPRLPRVRLPFDGLPEPLAGLRILHLSDLHLGVERRARDVEALAERLIATGSRPDLIVLTGDVAEDPRELLPALAALRAIRAPMGIVASLGNHEYFGDVARTRRDYERAGVPLLVGEGHTLSRGGRRVHVAGLDDPRAMHGDFGRFFTEGLEHALDGAPSDAFHLVLSHRPEGLEAAARSGMDLVLSGHTHGGQIGFANRSAFEPIWPEQYLWGRYRRGKTHLYTTSGFGHWFPFRLLCPAEAPLIELCQA